MITAGFDYEAPESVEEAVRILHENGEDAKILAGGHSLVPLMKLRLAAPTLLVDLRRVPGLHGIQQDNGGWRIGPMTRHADLQDTPELGVVSRAASQIADQQVRNRGTIAASPAVTAAVMDAVRPLGVEWLDMPLTPLRVWQAIQEGGAA